MAYEFYEWTKNFWALGEKAWLSRHDVRKRAGRTMYTL